MDGLGQRDLDGGGGEIAELARGDVDVGAAERGGQQLAQRDADALVARRPAQLAQDALGVAEVAHLGQDAGEKVGVRSGGDEAVVGEAASDVRRRFERGGERGVGRGHEGGEGVGERAPGERRREPRRAHGRALGVDRLGEREEAGGAQHEERPTLVHLRAEGMRGMPIESSGLSPTVRLPASPGGWRGA